MENALNLNTYEIRKYSFPFIYLFVLGGIHCILQLEESYK